jgi:hypothetical protein
LGWFGEAALHVSGYFVIWLFLSLLWSQFLP